MLPQATYSTNLASPNQTGTGSSRALTQSVALLGDASNVVRVWLSRASLNEHLATQSQVKYRLFFFFFLPEACYISINVSNITGTRSFVLMWK